jgi:hypothetical protein
MSERFTEILRAASEPAWSDAVRHRFVNAGRLPQSGQMGKWLLEIREQDFPRLSVGPRRHAGMGS